MLLSTELFREDRSPYSSRISIKTILFIDNDKINCNVSVSVENKWQINKKYNYSVLCLSHVGFMLILISSFRNFNATKGRLNGNSAWCPSSLNEKQYLKIDLGRLAFVEEIITQGEDLKIFANCLYAVVFFI